MIVKFYFRMKLKNSRKTLKLIEPLPHGSYFFFEVVAKSKKLVTTSPVDDIVTCHNF